MITIFNQMIFPVMNAMGDHFVAAGIVRHYAHMCEKIYLPVTQTCFPTLSTLYSNQPNVQLEIITNREHWHQFAEAHNLIKINHCDLRGKMIDNAWCTMLWDEQLYTLYQVPFSMRYLGFGLPHHLPNSEKLAQQIVTNPKYILTHAEIGPRPHDPLPIDIHYWRADAGLEPLENFQVIPITTQLSNNMLDYVDLIRNASEIHCVPSSMHCLVDSITPQTEAKLFFHDIRQDNLMRINNYWNNYRWNVINYSVKF